MTTKDNSQSHNINDDETMIMHGDEATKTLPTQSEEPTVAASQGEETIVLDTPTEDETTADLADTTPADGETTANPDQSDETMVVPKLGDETTIMADNNEYTTVLDTPAEDESDPYESESDASASSPDLPELNFDPAETPGAFDPRVTGEVDSSTTSADTASDDPFAPQVTDSPHPENPAPSEMGYAQPYSSGGQHYGANNTANLSHANLSHANPGHANPSHANPSHANPSYANPSYANPGRGGQQPYPAGSQPYWSAPHSPVPPGSYAGANQGAYAQREPERTIKFGLFTWGLTMCVIGVLVIFVSWWPLIEWPLVFAISFGVLGVIMLITAGLAYMKEKKLKRTGFCSASYMGVSSAARC